MSKSFLQLPSFLKSFLPNKGQKLTWSLNNKEDIAKFESQQSLITTQIKNMIENSKTSGKEKNIDFVLSEEEIPVATTKYRARSDSQCSNETSILVDRVNSRIDVLSIIKSKFHAPDSDNSFESGNIDNLKLSGEVYPDC